MWVLNFGFQTCNLISGYLSVFLLMALFLTWISLLPPTLPWFYEFLITLIITLTWLCDFNFWIYGPPWLHAWSHIDLVFWLLDLVTCTLELFLWLWLCLWILYLDYPEPSDTCCCWFQSSEVTWTCPVTIFCEIFTTVCYCVRACDNKVLGVIFSLILSVWRSP